MTQSLLARLEELAAAHDGLDGSLPKVALIREAAEVLRRQVYVPGVMRCAKCGFRLIRKTLSLVDGGVYAGSSESEPCPNGCGPLWPVTWREEAVEADTAMMSMLDRAEAAEKARKDETAARQRLQELIEPIVRAVRLEESRSPWISEDVIVLGRTQGANVRLGHLKALADAVRDEAEAVRG